VLRPDPSRPWESNYVTSGSVMRLADGSFRFWYASRKAPPFENLYFAINTARWSGPKDAPAGVSRLSLPPKKDDIGTLGTVPASAPASDGYLEALEIIDDDQMIVRAWYKPADEPPTFVDVWIRGASTDACKAGAAVELPGTYRATGNQSFGTTCGGRSVPLLELVK
jgi:hypothetical protein